jgi:hypothetical protein
LETIFAVLRYAKHCKMRTSPVSFSDLIIRKPDMGSPDRPFFTSEQVAQITGTAEEPSTERLAGRDGQG